jgi:DNA-binding MarR family transcriptional regulator
MDATFERRKRESVGQLLMKAGRLVDEQALRMIRQDARAPPVRPAHTRLFPHIAPEGIRLTELAERLGVTKQAVQPLVADLEHWGMVELAPDPSDGRARLVRWTPAGLQALVHGLGVLAELEDRLRTEVGAERWTELHAALQVITDLLERDPH